MASGLDRLLARHGAARSLVVVNYHRIRPAASAGFFSTDFDENVFGPTVEEFRSQMQWLKANRCVLSEADLLAALRSQRPERYLPASPALVTFDDGYVDNYTLALPILKELGIPAIFFISTQAVEERKLGWWDLISYLLKKSERDWIEFQGKRIELSKARDALRNELLQQMKWEASEVTAGLLSQLAEACEVPLPGPEISGRELMSWQEIREAMNSGIAIGSHTHSHRVLATLDLESQQLELARSKLILEDKLGQPVRTLAYPVGGYEHFHMETLTLAQRCGYEAAFSFLTGCNPVAELQRFDLRRVSGPEELSLFVSMLSLPGVFCRRQCALPQPRFYKETTQPFRLEVLSRWEEVEERASLWNDLLQRSETVTVFQTYEWHASWWKTIGQPSGVQLRVLWITRGDQVVAIAPLGVEGPESWKHRVRPLDSISSVTKKETLCFLGTSNFASDYADFIVDAKCASSVREVFTWVETWLSESDVRWERQADFFNLPTSSSTLPILQSRFSERGNRFSSWVTAEAPARLFSPHTGEGLHENLQLLNKKSLKRHFRAFEARGKLEFRHLDDAAEIQSHLENFFRQHRERRRLAGDQSQFQHASEREFYRELVRRLLPEGWLRFAIVTWNREVIAYHFGFEYGGKFIWYKPTFNAKYAKQSPGEVLLRFLFEYAIEKGLQEFDFTVGEEPFKYRFANVVRSNRRVVLFSDSMSAGLFRARRFLSQVMMKKVRGLQVSKAVAS